MGNEGSKSDEPIEAQPRGSGQVSRASSYDIPANKEVKSTASKSKSFDNGGEKKGGLSLSKSKSGGSSRNSRASASDKSELEAERGLNDVDDSGTGKSESLRTSRTIKVKKVKKKMREPTSPELQCSEIIRNLGFKVDMAPVHNILPSFRTSNGTYIVAVDDRRHFEYVPELHKNREEYREIQEKDVKVSFNLIKKGFRVIRITYEDMFDCHHHILRAMLVKEKLYLSDIRKYDYFTTNKSYDFGIDWTCPRTERDSTDDIPCPNGYDIVVEYGRRQLISKDGSVLIVNNRKTQFSETEMKVKDLDKNDPLFESYLYDEEKPSQAVYSNITDQWYKKKPVDKTG